MPHPFEDLLKTIFSISKPVIADTTNLNNSDANYKSHAHNWREGNDSNERYYQKALEKDALIKEAKSRHVVKAFIFKDKLYSEWGKNIHLLQQY